MPFLHNAWYVAAWADELSSSTLFTRTILGEQVLLYRDPEGMPVALSNICPHRFAPLHKGRLDKGIVECPYHGLAFNSNGQCARNPHGNGHIPPNMKLRQYPVREQFGIVWIWPGDAALADETALLTHDFLDPAHNMVTMRYLRMKANYQLTIDNALDLSHLQYLHAGSIGSDSIVRSEPAFRQEGNTVWSTRQIHSEKLPNDICKLLGLPNETHANRRLEVRCDPPGLITLRVEVNGIEGAPTLSYTTRSVHLRTPETESTTHYFYAFSYPMEMGKKGADFLKNLTDMLTYPFEKEDLPMLEMQQQIIGNKDFMSMQPTLLPIDGAAIRARRVMDQLIADERDTPHLKQA
jgi:phenylpropionate dioxygenase-like ring-hydroxylating dioxygenase large terminal subunit